MAIAFVRQNAGTFFTGTAASTLAVTFTTNPTQYNSMVAFIKTSSSGSVSSITDSKNTWTNVIAADGNVAPGAEIWTTTVGTTYGSGPQITINWSTNMNYVGIILLEFSGMSFTSTNSKYPEYTAVADQTGSNDRTSTSANSLQTALSATTLYSDELITTFCTVSGTSSVTWTVPSGWASGGPYYAGSASYNMAATYQIATATGTFSNTWDYSPTSTSQSAMASFFRTVNNTVTQSSQSYIIQDGGSNLPIIGAG